MVRRGVTEVENLQTWFMDIAAGVLREEGKSVAVWDEASEIWDADDALVITVPEGV